MKITTVILAAFAAGALATEFTTQNNDPHEAPDTELAAENNESLEATVTELAAGNNEPLQAPVTELAAGNDGAPRDQLTAFNIQDYGPSETPDTQFAVQDDNPAGAPHKRVLVLSERSQDQLKTLIISGHSILRTVEPLTGKGLVISGFERSSFTFDPAVDFKVKAVELLKFVGKMGENFKVFVQTEVDNQRILVRDPGVTQIMQKYAFGRRFLALMLSVELGIAFAADVGIRVMSAVMVISAVLCLFLYKVACELEHEALCEFYKKELPIANESDSDCE